MVFNVIIQPLQKKGVVECIIFGNNCWMFKKRKIKKKRWLDIISASSSSSSDKGYLYLVEKNSKLTVEDIKQFVFI